MPQTRISRMLTTLSLFAAALTVTPQLQAQGPSFLIPLALIPQQVAAPAPAPDPASMPESGPLIMTVNPRPDPIEYTAGLKAMDESRWADALKDFDKLATKRPEYAESALFWKAYNLEKLGRKEEANATCAQLIKEHSKSSWIQECEQLRVEANIDLSALKVRTEMVNGKPVVVTVDRAGIDAARVAAQVQANIAREQARQYRDYSRDLYRDLNDSKTPHDPNDDIKLLALNSLMGTEPEKALPVLRDFILSDKPIELRRHALFVLGQSKDPGAQKLLTEIANNNKDVSLQRSAIQTLANTRGKDANPQLVQIYRASSTPEIKRAAMSALFNTGDAKDLVDLSRAEKDMDMKRELVSQLALMHDPAATAYMEELLK